MSISTCARSSLILAILASAVVTTPLIRSSIGQEAAPPTNAASEMPPIVEQTKQSADEFDKMVAILNEPAAFDFLEMPLDEALNEVSKMHNVRMHLDRTVLDDLGIEPDVPITFQLKGTRLGTALELMFRQLGLSFTRCDNVLVVTSLESENARLSPRVYNVVSLIDCEHIQSSVDGLIDLLTSTDADSWEEFGGAGTISFYQGNLVISQAFRVHIQIDKLLKQLASNIQQMGGPKMQMSIFGQTRPERDGGRVGFGGGF